MCWLYLGKLQSQSSFPNTIMDSHSSPVSILSVILLGSIYQHIRSHCRSTGAHCKKKKEKKKCQMTHNPPAALGFSADASLSPDFMIHTQQWCRPPITHLQQFCVKHSHWDTASKCNFCSLQNQHCPINETSHCIIIEHRCILYGWNGSYSTEICYTRIIRARRMERLSDLTM